MIPLDEGATAALPLHWTKRQNSSSALHLNRRVRALRAFSNGNENQFQTVISLVCPLHVRAFAVVCSIWVVVTVPSAPSLAFPASLLQFALATSSQMRASVWSFSTPSPSAYKEPRLTCSAACPCPSASRCHLADSTSSFA